MKQSHSLLLVPAFIGLILLSACGGGNNGNTSNVPQTICNLDTDTVSFSSHVTPIFIEICTECHMPGTLFDQKPYLTAENAYNNLVANPVRAPGSIPFVIAGDPENSQIYRKIIGDERAGDQMPLGRTPLTTDQMCYFKKWITQGAKNN